MSLQDVANRLRRKEGQRDQLQSMLKSEQDNLSELQDTLANQEQAQAAIQTVAQQTQQQLEYHVSELVTLAMKAVFTDPYEVELEFVQKRSKTECEIWFVRDGERMKPLSAAGGGAVDVAALALRLSLWCLRQPRTRPVVLLDEPLRFLSVDLQEKASIILRELSNRLGLQLIIVTHEEELQAAAHRTFRVTKSGATSKLTWQDVEESVKCTAESSDTTDPSRTGTRESNKSSKTEKSSTSVKRKKTKKSKRRRRKAVNKRG